MTYEIRRASDAGVFYTKGIHLAKEHKYVNPRPCSKSYTDGEIYKRTFSDKTTQDFADKWFITIESLEDFESLLREVGSIIVHPKKSDGIDGLIIIYDDKVEI